MIACVLGGGCVAAPPTCESYANPAEVCARVDGALFIDGGWDSAVDAATFDAATFDAPIDRDAGHDAGICDPEPPSCVDEATCAEWGLAAAPPGTFAATICGVGPVCSRGVTNCVTAGAGTYCQCSVGYVCVNGQICVADTPGGPARCVPACAGP